MRTNNEWKKRPVECVPGIEEEDEDLVYKQATTIRRIPACVADEA